MSRGFFGKLRKYEKHFTTLAFAYRTIRDTWAFHRQRPYATPHGFNLMGNRAMEGGVFEAEESALIRRLLEDAEVFVDVGANIGFYTCLAQASQKYTIAVEPLAQNLDYLYANLNANGWRDVEIYPVGLAERPGIATLHGGATGASLVRGWADASPLLRRTVALSTLDIVLGERFKGRRLLIKVDIEGAEFRLLQGASRALVLSPAPVWIVEISLTEHHPAGLNPNYVNTFEIFWERGYQSWTANIDRRPISRVDVERWARSGSPEFGTGNYLFTKT